MKAKAGCCYSMGVAALLAGSVALAAEPEVGANLRWQYLAAWPDARLAAPVQAGTMLARLLLLVPLSDRWSVQWHGLQYVSGQAGASGGLPGARLVASSGGRSLRWHQLRRPGAEAFFEVDRANLRGQIGRAELTVGRQPINLAAAYFFVPNDLFQPFQASEFFRLYKPGVDGLRLEYPLGREGRWTLAAVSDVEAMGQKSTSSVVVRPVFTGLGAEWGALLAWHRGAYLVGGHVLRPVGTEGTAYVSGHLVLAPGREPRGHLAVGGSLRLSPETELRAEYFRRGGGATDAAQYLTAALARAPYASPYLARDYGALGLAWQAHPLLQVSGVVLANLVDPSAWLAGTLGLSLDDEWDAVATIAIPLGPVGTGLQAGSEFGRYPALGALELRGYL